MKGPRYLRKVNGQESEYPAHRNSFPDDATTSRQSLEVTGLRERKLIFLVIWLVVLSILAILILIVNLLLIRVLRINHHGMRSLRIHTYEDPVKRTEEKLVHFAAPSADLGHVVANSGQIFGSKGQNLIIEGSRVIMNGGLNSTRLMLQDSKCRFDTLNQFQIVNSLGKILFSAQHPFVTIDNKIKQIAADYIITNKIRSPINEDLIIKAENANLRGNEGIKMEARRFNLTSATIINFKTSADGTIRINGTRVFLGNRFRSLEISTSPALTASVEAYRVCICNSVRPKLFIVDGNKNCNAATNFFVNGMGVDNGTFLSDSPLLTQSNTCATQSIDAALFFAA